MKEEEHQIAHFTLFKQSHFKSRWDVRDAHGSLLGFPILWKSSDLAKFKALEHFLLGMFCSSFTSQEVHPEKETW